MRFPILGAVALLSAGTPALAEDKPWTPPAQVSVSLSPDAWTLIAQSMQKALAFDQEHAQRVLQDLASQYQAQTTPPAEPKE